MFMEIALPKMGELFVMMMTMISPSEREVPPAESLRQSPRLVLPRGGGVSSEKMAYYFSHRKPSYSRRWPPEGHQGAHEVGGRAPHPRGQGVAPGEFLPLSIFYIF